MNHHEKEMNPGKKNTAGNLRMTGIILLASMLLFAGTLPESEMYQIRKGIIRFVSDAPQELIKGYSKELKGVIDPGKRTFAFSIYNRSIKGFNSALEQEHFYENYIEADKYPYSTFEGKIIETIDFTKNGDYNVRAKGIFKIHGISQERIIESSLKVFNGIITIKSQFTVLLSDHDIIIPKIVYLKIAKEISIEVEAEFTKINPAKK